MIQCLILQELFNSIALFYKISTFSFALFSKVRLKMCAVCAAITLFRLENYIGSKNKCQVICAKNLTFVSLQRNW